MGRTLPDPLPILSSRLGRDGPRAVYEEPEITTPVDLCTPDGRLAAAAIGWSRRPLVRNNVRGDWPRKKRGNFWNWIAPCFVFSVTVADVDYAAFCQVTFIDFDRKRTVTRTELVRPGSIALPDHVERTVSFLGRSLHYAAVYDGDGVAVQFDGASKAGDVITAEFRVHIPPNQESLNVVVPWTPTRFQSNSKHNTLPCEGFVRVGGERYTMRPEECHGVQDFGRGVWPYRSFWNWGVATGASGSARIGVNVG